MTGYIKDHRKELESDIWQMPPLYHRTWQWLKYNVNHADNEIPMRDGTKMLIKRGQRLTSVRDIAKGISWYEGKKPKEPNPKTISAILDWMIKTNMIFIDRGKGNREYTLITIINYEVYNEKESQGNSKETPSGEGRKQQADINKNDKELKKNDKKVNKEPKTLYAENVSLTEKEYENLCSKFSKEQTDLSIKFLSSYKIEKAYKTKDDNLTIQRWVLDAVKKSNTIPFRERGQTNAKPGSGHDRYTDEQLNAMSH